MNLANKIICGDCLEVLPRVPDNSVDLVITSPPYDDLRLYGGKYKLDFHKVGVELLRVVKPAGIAVVVIGDAFKDGVESLTSFRLAVDWVDGVGWRMFESLIWKNYAVPGQHWNFRFRKDHQHIFCFAKAGGGQSSKPYFNKDAFKVPMKYAEKKNFVRREKNGSAQTRKIIKTADPRGLVCGGSVWHLANNLGKDKWKFKHPATFPDKLARRVITAFTKEGDLVMDPMAGSGTSAVEAKKLGRRYCGIEIYKPYAKIAEQRLANTTPNLL